MTSVGIPCSLMRGGTSKGLFFLADDLPSDIETRDRVLLAVMGSPDVRQIDGLGGGHPLTSKVAVIRRSEQEGVDVDYLFLQVQVDRAEVSDGQNCGNILAGVGAFAIQNGLVVPSDSQTSVTVNLLNSGGLARLEVPTPKGEVEFEGSCRISGVPGSAAAVPVEFLGVAGATCGALLPTGRTTDVIDGVEVSCIDAGMPVVLMHADDLQISGSESPASLEENQTLCDRVERIRLEAGRLMNLGEVADKTIPKMSIVSPPQAGGLLNTRTFIPKRVHEAIGVLGAVSVAAACAIPDTVAHSYAAVKQGDTAVFDIEHPTGYFSVEVDVDEQDDQPVIRRSALVRTARLLMTGMVFVPGSIWPKTSGPL